MVEPGLYNHNNRNSVICAACGWRVCVPRRGAGQPFDEAMAYHEHTTSHGEFSFPVEDGDEEATYVLNGATYRCATIIADSDLKVGAAYLAGRREGTRNENLRIRNLIKEGN